MLPSHLRQLFFFSLLRVVDLFVVPLHFYLVVDMSCHVCLSADIPVFPTVTAVITLERDEEVQTETSKFLVPRDYHKVSLSFPRGSVNMDLWRASLIIYLTKAVNTHGMLDD